MAHKGTTKIDYEAAEIRVVDLFRTTPLNRSEIAEIMNMSRSEVGSIVARHHAIKGQEVGGGFVRPGGLSPCMLTITAWPRCYGQGCHWVNNAGESECSAYNAMQVKIS